MCLHIYLKQCSCAGRPLSFLCLSRLGTMWHCVSADWWEPRGPEQSASVSSPDTITRSKKHNLTVTSCTVWVHSVSPCALICRSSADIHLNNWNTLYPLFASVTIFTKNHPRPAAEPLCTHRNMNCLHSFIFSHTVVIKSWTRTFSKWDFFCRKSSLKTRIPVSFIRWSSEERFHNCLCAEVILSCTQHFWSYKKPSINLLEVSEVWRVNQGFLHQTEHTWAELLPWVLETLVVWRAGWSDIFEGLPYCVGDRKSTFAGTSSAHEANVSNTRRREACAVGQR